MSDAPRTRILKRRHVLLLALACQIAPGCDRLADGGAEADAPEIDGAAAEPAAGPSAIPPSEPLPARIYFQLTDYDWYARGEPLVYASASYRAARGVIAAPTSAMRKVGEYHGVDVYTNAGADTDSAVYVPVFPGYWQAFHLTEPAAAAASGS
jgi:hypothetical protein